MMSTRPSNRSLLLRLIALLLCTAFAVTACGSDSDDAGDSPDTTAAPGETESDAGDDTSDGSDDAAADEAAAAFPVTIEHKFGETTIDAEPQRIVTVGYLDQDAVLALGKVPVATSEWFGEHPGAIWPWATDELEDLGGELPTVMNLTGEGSDLETIAAQQPDLILAVYSGLTDEQYEGLSAIAPTVAQPAEYDDWTVPWDELALTVGKALGQEPEAQALVDEINGLFEQARADYPELAGKTGLIVTPYDGVFVYGPSDVRGRFLAVLGMEPPAGLVEAVGEDWGGELSLERVDLLDVDALIWLDADTATGSLGGAAYDQLEVHTGGHEVLLNKDDPWNGALSFQTVLSLPGILENIVPQIAAAVAGK